jgi:hypothetical protein
MDSLRLPVTKGLIERHGGDFSIMRPPNDGITVRPSFPPERILQVSNVPLPHNSVNLGP